MSKRDLKRKMVIGKLFFRQPILDDFGLVQNQYLPFREANEASSYILFELPVNCVAVPYYAWDKYPDNAGVRVNVGLWFPNPNFQADMDSKKYLTYYLEGDIPITYRRIIDFLHKKFSPITSMFAKHSSNLAIARQLMETYLHSPDFFYACIAKGPSPTKIFERDWMIILLWDEWNKKRLLMQERVDEMQKLGLAKGLTHKNICKRAGDLGLPPAK